jgi:hypothetical protein
MGQGHGKPTAQNPRGLRYLPRPHPHRATSHTAHAVVTGEPDDRETIKSGSAGGRAEKDQHTLAPRCAADPSSWTNNFGKLRRCTDHDGTIVDFYLYLAAAFVTLRCLIREARQTYRWDNRPTTGRLK